MAIPDFQTIMLPLLKQLGDGEEHTNQETADVLAREFDLTDEERSQLLPSGSQTVFTNRVAWAKAHFKRAGLIEPTRRGVYRITDRGRDLLHQNPQRIDLKFLDQFPGHREFRTSTRKAVEPLQGQRARKGIFITSSDFSKEARDYAASIENKIILVSGEELAKLMIDHGVGVTEVASYIVKRIDSDYFGQE
jgi:restriction endonuclease Mrr